MKTKHFILFCLAVVLSLQLQAQEGVRCYTTLGLSPKDSFGLRVGVLKNRIGGEVLLKSDVVRLGKELSKYDGRKYHMAVMGGVSYWLIHNLMLSANVGYGVSGLYKVDATQTTYGVDDLKTGIEAGLSLNILFNRSFIFYFGLSCYPLGQSEDLNREYSIGIGYMF